MLNTKITHKEYLQLRARLVKSRDSIGNAYNDTNNLADYIFDNDFIGRWNEIHAIQGKLWESHCYIDTLIMRLDQEYSKLNKQ